MKSILKKIWQVTPTQLRESFIRCLCVAQISVKKKPVAFQKDAPVYIIGCFQAGGGISRSVQLYATNLQKNNSHIICVDTTELTMQNIKNSYRDGTLRYLNEIKDNNGAGVVIIHHNPPQFQRVLCKLGKKFLQNKHLVGFWAWELDDLPSLWKSALRYVDAVEVPSSFTQRAVAKHTAQPVSVKPHIVPAPQEVKTTYCKDGKLRCLFIMHMASLAIRKNPEATIKAFMKAFPNDEAELTIKITKDKYHEADFASIYQLVKGKNNIKIVTDWMDDRALTKMYIEHDVFLSLHRSEGYGLTIREAMLHGLYVIATGWSGNMDFMQGEKCFAVKYSLVPVPKNTMFGRVSHAKWAEADVEDAVDILRNIYVKLKKI